MADATVALSRTRTQYPARAAWDRLNARRIDAIGRLTCEWCREQFIPKRPDRTRFCGRKCSFGYRAQQKAHRAGTRAAKPVWFKACRECGQLFTAKTEAASVCGKNCDARARYRHKTLHRRKHRTCVACGRQFFTDYGNKRTLFCSKRCLRRTHHQSHHSNHRKRARHYGVQYEPIDRIKVFERDGWRCQICGETTAKEMIGTFSDDAPELDHRIPMAKGGGHTWENVQCAHRGCNNRKGASVA